MIYKPADLVEVYILSREEWAEGLVIESIVEKNEQVSYAVELNNGEILESISSSRLRRRSVLSRFIPFEHNGSASSSPQKTDENCLRLVPRWTLSSPPLPKGDFNLPPIEPPYQHCASTTEKEVDSQHSNSWPFPLQQVTPFQLHEGAEKAARRMVTAPLMPFDDSLGEKGRQSKFTFVRAENVLNPALLKSWRRKLKETRIECSATASQPEALPNNRIQHSSPVLAWHSTPWHGNIDKIIHHGVLVSGDRLGDSNSFLGSAHGQRFGKGTYTTPNIELTECYGFEDMFDRRQALLCLVNLGNSHLLAPSSPKDEKYLNSSWDKFVSAYEGKTLQSLAQDKLPHWVDLEAPCDHDGKFRPVKTFQELHDCNLDVEKRYLPTPNTQGHWQVDPLSDNKKKFGFHSFVSPDRQQYVTARSDQVLPLLLVTYEPRRPMDWTKRFPKLKIPIYPSIRFRKLFDKSDFQSNEASVLKESDEVWTVDMETPLKTLPRNAAGSSIAPIHLVLISEASDESSEICGALMREFSSVVPQHKIAACFFNKTMNVSDGENDDHHQVEVGGFGSISSSSSLLELSKTCAKRASHAVDVNKSHFGLGGAMLLAFELAHRQRVQSFIDAKMKAVRVATTHISQYYADVQSSNERSTDTTIEEVPSSAEQGVIMNAEENNSSDEVSRHWPPLLCQPSSHSTLSLSVQIPRRLFDLVSYVNNLDSSSWQHDFDEVAFMEWAMLRRHANLFEEQRELDVKKSTDDDEEEEEEEEFILIEEDEDAVEDELESRKDEEEDEEDENEKDTFHTVEIPVLAPFASHPSYNEVMSALVHELHPLLTQIGVPVTATLNSPLELISTFDSCTRQLHKTLQKDPLKLHRHHRKSIVEESGECGEVCCGVEINSSFLSELFRCLSALFPSCGNGQAPKAVLPFLRFESKTKLKSFQNSAFYKSIQAYLSGIEAKVMGIVMTENLVSTRNKKTSAKENQNESKYSKSFSKRIRFVDVLSMIHLPSLPSVKKVQHRVDVKAESLKQPAEQWVSFEEARAPLDENTGYSLNWGLKVDLRQKRIASKVEKMMEKYVSPLFVFVVVLKGGNVHRTTKEKKKMEEEGRSARNCGMQTVLKFMVLNESSSEERRGLSFPMVVSMNKSLQTIDHYSPSYGVYNMKLGDAMDIVKSARLLSTGVLGSLGYLRCGMGTLTVSIDPSEQKIGRGFVDTLLPASSVTGSGGGSVVYSSGWGHQASWSESFPRCIEEDGDIHEGGIAANYAVLYCGKPPRALRINGTVFGVRVIDDSADWSMHDVEVHLAALRKGVNSLQVLAVLNKGVSSLVKMQIGMVRSCAKKLKMHASSTSLTTLREQRSKIASFSTKKMQQQAAAGYFKRKTVPTNEKSARLLQDVEGYVPESTPPDLSLWSPLNRALLAVLGRKRRALIAEIQNVVNSAESTLLLGQAASDVECHHFLNNLANERYGVAAMKRSSREVGSVTAEDIALDLMKKFEKHLSCGVDASSTNPTDSLYKLINELKASSEHSQGDIIAMARNVGVIGLLGAYGYANGVLINLQRSNASTVNPWLIMVRSVSSEWASISEALWLAENEGEEKIKKDPAERKDDFTRDYCKDIVVSCPFTQQVETGNMDVAKDDLTRVFLRTSLFESYLGVAFARSPSVLIPGSQRPALLAVVLVRSLELVLRSKMQHGKNFRTVPGIRGVVRNALCLWLTLRKECLGWSKSLAQSLATSDNPSDLLTEASPIRKDENDRDSQGVASVCQALVALFHENALPLFLSSSSDGKLPAVALALLGEAVARSCRVEIKQESQRSSKKSELSLKPTEAPYRPLLRRALGITMDSCQNCELTNDRAASEDGLIHSIEYDINVGSVWSGRFFSHTYTNATPWAVVATIGFAKSIATFAANIRNDDETANEPNDDGWTDIGNEDNTVHARRWLNNLYTDYVGFEKLCDHIFEAFDTPSMISMKRFAKIYLPSSQNEGDRGTSEKRNRGLELQVAMYVHGLRYSKAHSRLESKLSLSNPSLVLSTLAQEERRLMYEDVLIEKKKRERAIEEEKAKKSRRGTQLLRARDFRQSHAAPNLPKLFTPFEVDELNQARPPTDQLELMAGGLLKHHCTCVSCPLYLVDLRTDKDRVLGTRHGLFKHMKHFLIGERDYWPGLHVQCYATFQKYVKSPRSAKSQRSSQIEAGKAVLMSRYEKSSERFGSLDQLKVTINEIFDQLDQI